MGHNVLSLSDRDLISLGKSFRDYTGSKYLKMNLVSKTITNFKPDMVIMGHADRIETKMLADMKNSHKTLKIAQWFLILSQEKAQIIIKINQEFLIN